MLNLRNHHWFFGLALLLSGQSLLPTAIAESPNDREENSTSKRLLSPQQRAAIGIESRPAKTEWQRLRLSVAGRRLERDLDRFETAAEWQVFLRLPKEFASLDTERKMNSLQTLCERFAAVAAKEQYQTVATMPSFRMMREALENHLALLEETSILGQKIPPAVESFSSEIRIAQESPKPRKSIQRLPPVLVPGAHPQLLTPPQENVAP